MVNSFHILLVEDSSSDADLVKEMLAEVDEIQIKIEHAETLSESLTLLETSRPNVILLDLGLPDSDGLAALHKIAARADYVPIIVMTGLDDRLIALKSLQSGASDYVIKGQVDCNMLVRAMVYAVERKGAETRLKLQYKTAQFLAESSCIQSSIGAILAEVCPFFGWDCAVFSRISETEEGIVNCSAVWCKEKAKLEELREHLESGSLPLKFERDNLWDRNHPLFTIDAATISHFTGCGNAAVLPNVRSAFIQPVATDGKEFGVLVFLSQHVTEQEHSTTELVAAIAQQIGHAMLRQQAEQGQVRLAAIVESSDDAIIGKNLAGVITSWNQGAEQLFGYPSSETVGKSISIIVPPECIDEVPWILEHVAIGEAIKHYETVRIKENGERIDVSISISPVRIASGTIIGASSIARDISGRKRAEAIQRETELRLRIALQAAAVGVWEIDLATGAVWRSPRHDEIFGFDSLSPDWSLEKSLSFIVPEDRARIEEVVRNASSTGSFNTEFRIIRVDQSLRWLSAQGEIFKDNDGKSLRLIGAVSDITEHKQREEQSRLIAVMEEREEFMATLTHDLKNPLIGANRVVELLVMDDAAPLTVDQRRLLLMLKESNSGLLSLTQNLIDVYRYEKEATSKVFADIDLTRLIVGCFELIKPIAAQRGIQITLCLAEEMKSVWADSTGVRRIIQNLLDNAVKFSPDNGSIQVRAYKQEDDALIEVEDNGQGISPQEQKLLFKRFSQGAAGKRYAAGSGLGLYLCKQIAEAHGGTIECVSEMNIATTFRVRLPGRHEKGKTRRLAGHSNAA